MPRGGFEICWELLCFFGKHKGRKPEIYCKAVVPEELAQHLHAPDVSCCPHALHHGTWLSDLCEKAETIVSENSD
jgi:hypothetical protein